MAEENAPTTDATTDSGTSDSAPSAAIQITRKASNAEVKDTTDAFMQSIGVTDAGGKVDPVKLAAMSDDEIRSKAKDFAASRGEWAEDEGVNLKDLTNRLKSAASDARANAVMYNADPDDEKGDFDPYEGTDFDEIDPRDVGDGDKPAISEDDPNTPENKKGGGVNDLKQVPIDGKGTKIWVWKDDNGNVHQSATKPKVDAAGTDPSKTEDQSSTGGENQEASAPEIQLTDFERVGIIEDRHIAVTAPGDFSHKAPANGDAPPDFTAGTLADGMNYMINVAAQKPHSGTRRSEAQQGFVNRSIPDYEDKTYFEQIIEMAYETSGMGGSETQLAQVFSRFDRFGRAMVAKNQVLTGYTFFTRPRLCLRDWNICADRKLSHLMTTEINSIPFAIRCLLDPDYSFANKDASKSPLFDQGNPFLTPLCNAVRSVSGFNDPMLATETTDGGFFSEDQTYVIGGDRLSRTYDINCLFRDYPGNPIITIIDSWCQYMAGLTDGSLQQYTDAIDLNRMDYTVSIYRFLMDRTNRNIVRWAKCTGCFPVSPPSGVVFNLNEGENNVDAASTINVPFKANRIEYDDPVILKEFNMLVRRYASKELGLESGGKPKAFSNKSAANNFCGLPYIRISQLGYAYELVWLKRDKVGEYIFHSTTQGNLGGIFRTEKLPGNNGDFRTDQIPFML